MGPPDGYDLVGSLTNVTYPDSVVADGMTKANREKMWQILFLNSCASGCPQDLGWSQTPDPVVRLVTPVSGSKPEFGGQHGTAGGGGYE